MLRWSMNLFRIRGIQLAVHGSFFLLLGYYAWYGWDTGGGLAALWSAGMLLAFFACVVLHELGHSFTARRFGVNVSRILLMPIGGMAEFDSIPRRPRSELLITLAGPAVNFLLAALLIIFVRFPRGWDPPATPDSLAELGRQLLVANLVMGCFNLAPVFPMDGGRILRALLAYKLPYVDATFWAMSVGKVLAAAAIAAGFIYGYYLVAALFLFIFIAGDAEYRFVKRRELEQARWAEAMRPLYREPPPLHP
ncbi:MAG: site-2 protease family protein [Verrucomicrobiota bacterium]|nr:site-2 protease family protein [Verrucomicrobiota bacterium]